MTEHLFKLKKDGKTVGYLEFKDGKFVYSNEDGSYVSPYCISIWNGKVFSFQCPAYGSSYYEHDECEYDSLHPFVTKDKNGKDVFAGDKVKGHGVWGSTSESKVVFSYKSGAEVEIGDNWVNLSRFRDIELIEDKENEELNT